mmetsp:Transcript_16311/g.19394  ORF Transcript_16311/g.19394 Transcript_16311/m.19394 type:complete len:350 (+) Transcript_16311:375-1424(+)
MALTCSACMQQESEMVLSTPPLRALTFSMKPAAAELISSSLPELMGLDSAPVEEVSDFLEGSGLDPVAVLGWLLISSSSFFSAFSRCSLVIMPFFSISTAASFSSSALDFSESLLGFSASLLDFSESLLGFPESLLGLSVLDEPSLPEASDLVRLSSPPVLVEGVRADAGVEPASGFITYSTDLASPVAAACFKTSCLTSFSIFYFISSPIFLPISLTPAGPSVVPEEEGPSFALLAFSIMPATLALASARAAGESACSLVALSAQERHLFRHSSKFPHFFSVEALRADLSAAFYFSAAAWVMRSTIPSVFSLASTLASRRARIPFRMLSTVAMALFLNCSSSAYLTSH